jgi:hypothetical protein
MNTLEIVLTTISGMVLLEGLIIATMSKKTIKVMRKMFKNKKEVVKIGMIEIILALLVLFLIAL